MVAMVTISVVEKVSKRCLLLCQNFSHNLFKHSKFPAAVKVAVGAFTATSMPAKDILVSVGLNEGLEGVNGCLLLANVRLTMRSSSRRKPRSELEMERCWVRLAQRRAGKDSSGFAAHGREPHSPQRGSPKR